MVINGENVRKIHKKIYEMTLKMPKMFLVMTKITNKSVKIVNKNKTKDENADLLLLLFSKNHYNSAVKTVINYELMENTEKEKEKVIQNTINKARDENKWVYIASSHNDCAEDHKGYQGKLYYDNKAPKDIVDYCKNRGMNSLQWVMDGPVWFITRPNCRHFVKALNADVIKKYRVKELTKRYKMHRSEGDRSLATPKKIAIEEYQDRLRLLQTLYAKHPTEKLRRDIQKTKLLIKKWKNEL